jgi:hypothetical protein
MARKRIADLSPAVSAGRPASHRRAPLAASEERRLGASISPPQPGPSGADGDPEVTQEDIARLAYALWEQRGGQGGSPEDDWYRAERQLQGRE